MTSGKVDSNANEQDKLTGKSFDLQGLLTRSLVTLGLCCLGSFCAGCVFSLMGPFFPREAEKKGVSKTVIGFIFAVFELIFFIFSPIYGYYIKRIGVRFLYISGILNGGCCTILFGFLDKSPPAMYFIMLCIGCRVVIALGMSACVTAGFAILSNEFPKHVATVFGIIATFEAVGLTVGPCVGVFLYELGGFGLPFFVMGSFMMLNGFLIWANMPPPREPDRREEETVLGLLHNSMVPLCALCITMVSLGNTFIEPTLATHLLQFTASPLYVGLVFMIAPLVYAVTAPMWGYLTDTKNIQSPLIVIGNLGCALAMLCIGPCPWLFFLPFKLNTIIVGLVLYGLCTGCVFIASMKSILLGALKLGFEDNLDTYGIVSGVYNSAFCLGAFAGPLLGGLLSEHIGFRFGTTVVAGFHIFMMLVSFSFFSHWNNRQGVTHLP